MEKIKIQIAGRMYPLTISLQEEQYIREAGKQIEKMILNYEKNFAVTDKQDALAMCTLQLASQLERQKKNNKEIQKQVEERVKNLFKLLEKVEQ